jgi:Coenzyme PQQ synthesis protein D (PqqD)
VTTLALKGRASSFRYSNAMTVEHPDARRPQRVTIDETTAWQMVDGRVVMLELDSEHYFRLDAVGSRMWELLSTDGDVDAAYARLLEEYEVDGDVLRTDLEDFVERLIAKGLLRGEPIQE